MKQNKALQVLFDNRVVGTLALAANHKVVFQYDDSWLEQGFSIRPFSLPLENQVFVPTKDYFDGLFGVLLAVGTMAGMKKELCMDIITEIKSCINGMLEMYLK